jgi:uncharacterized RDD family membrane protein YckC
MMVAHRRGRGAQEDAGGQEGEDPQEAEDRQAEGLDEDRLTPGPPRARPTRTHRASSLVRFLPTLLLLASFPAGIVGYTLGAAVMSALPIPTVAEVALMLFVPLLVGGLFMVPFLIPFFDRKAKQDLEAHRREQSLAKRGSRKRRR